MLADLSKNTRTRYILLIFILAVINIGLYPLALGTVPFVNGKYEYAKAYSGSIVLFLISYTFLGIIIGGGIAAFSNNKSIPLKERTIDKSLTVILVIQSIFAIFNILEFFA